MNKNPAIESRTPHFENSHFTTTLNLPVATVRPRIRLPFE